jgi:hypothetical protein
MHQPNMFVNTYLGYTMWDYEADAPFMWPEKQKYPTTEEIRHVLDRNPEGAAPKGNWGDLDFLRRVFDLNNKLNDTQCAAPWDRPRSSRTGARSSANTDAPKAAERKPARVTPEPLRNERREQEQAVAC